MVLPLLPLYEGLIQTLLLWCRDTFEKVVQQDKDNGKPRHKSSTRNRRGAQAIYRPPMRGTTDDTADGQSSHEQKTVEDTSKNQAYTQTSHANPAQSEL